MKRAADFRQIARSALSGRWMIAVLAGVVAALLGGMESGGVNFNLNIYNSGGSEATYTGGMLSDELIIAFIILFVLIFVIAIFVSLFYLFIGSIVGAGYAKFNLDLVDRQEEPQIGTLFAFFKRWKTLVAAGFLRGLYVFLWSLLFVIPGIVADYSYAMTNYVLVDNPWMTANEAIEKSKSIMYGNRWRLFCLKWSFIGWDILCVFTFGIGNLWLAPYKQAARAAFYREVSGTEYIPEPAEPAEPAEPTPA